MAVGILYAEELKEYDFGSGHPFRGDRYELFMEFLKDRLSENHDYQIIKAEPATEGDLRKICRKDYIDFTKEFYEAAYRDIRNMRVEYIDRFSNYHSGDNLPLGSPGRIEQAARMVIGQAKLACQLVKTGRFKKVVSIGGGLHHAKPAYGEGFCLYNDVAFCVKHLMDEYKLKRILVLDTDAHAGNGTADYFYEDPRVLLIDLHQDPSTLYPRSGFAHQIGARAGQGFTVNIPLPVQADYECYQLVFDSLVEPLIQEFKPQIIVRNGGSDPYLDDGLTNLGLSVEGFRKIGDRVRKISRICEDRVIDLIASGYNKKILPYAWLALISGLAGVEPKIEEPDTGPLLFRPGRALTEIKKVVKEVKSHLQDYWKCLQ
ncbi:MAG: histone deacetylase family protein [Candidatus Aminicenantes bacterium]